MANTNKCPKCDGKLLCYRTYTDVDILELDEDGTPNECTVESPDRIFLSEKIKCEDCNYKEG